MPLPLMIDLHAHKPGRFASAPGASVGRRPVQAIATAALLRRDRGGCGIGCGRAIGSRARRPRLPVFR